MSLRAPNNGTTILRNIEVNRICERERERGKISENSQTVKVLSKKRREREGERKRVRDRLCRPYERLKTGTNRRTTQEKQRKEERVEK